MKFSDKLKQDLSEAHEGKITLLELENRIIESFIESHKKSILIVNKARQVRDLQKEYFKSHRGTVLEASKKAERELDALIAPEPAPNPQKEIFNN